MKVLKIPIPSPSLIEKALPKVDYHDSFSIEVPGLVPVQKLPPLFFKSFPKWFMLLMGIREGISRLIGLKTAAGIDVRKQVQNFSGEVGESIALFHVLGRSKTEILSGENDSHLDFRLSFFANPTQENTNVILSTTVCFNAWTGKAYFLPVRPIHKFIMPILMKRMRKNWIRSQKNK